VFDFPLYQWYVKVVSIDLTPVPEFDDNAEMTR